MHGKNKSINFIFSNEMNENEDFVGISYSIERSSNVQYILRKNQTSYIGKQSLK